MGVRREDPAVREEDAEQEEEEREAQAEGGIAVVQRAAEHLAGCVGVEKVEVEQAEGGE